MNAPAQWALGALVGSTILMLVVLAVRRPVRRWVGPQFGYALWAFPALRMIVPPLPADLFGVLQTAEGVGGRLSALVVGPHGPALWPEAAAARWHTDTVCLMVWLIGAAALLGVHVARHIRFCRRLQGMAAPLGIHGTVHLVASDVAGPLAFGVFHRYVAVPRDFTTRYDAREQQLALAHECAHHARHDLAANWASLAILAAHWWNPVAWAAIRAFREDQEFAVDADVLAQCDAGARPAYAQVLAKAAGIGALPIANLNPRSNLKGRLMMLGQQPSTRNRMMGGTALTLLAAGTLAMTVSAGSAATPPAGRQAVTIGIKPDGAGAYALIVGGAAVAPGTPLPGGATLPADFAVAGGCDLKPAAQPLAMVIKGFGDVRTYTILCASAKPAPIRTTLGEGLASLRKMRGMVATQPSSPVFPETERSHALGAIDGSIREVQTTLARTN